MVALTANPTKCTMRRSSDNLGTVRNLAEYDDATDTTAVVDHYVYDAFGNETAHTGSNDFLFKYTARAFDEETGLQNNLNRWFDAKIGRWLSEDPIGFDAGDANVYRYVGNFATGAVDPDGLEPKIVGHIGKLYAPVAAKLGAMQIAATNVILAGNRLKDALANSTIANCNAVQQAQLRLNQAVAAYQRSQRAVNTAISRFRQDIAGNATAQQRLAQGQRKVAQTVTRAQQLIQQYANNRVVTATARQLERKFKHASDFGIGGTAKPANLDRFYQAIQRHINSNCVREIVGTFRQDPVKFFTDPNTGLTVMTDRAGNVSVHEKSIDLGGFLVVGVFWPP